MFTLGNGYGQASQFTAWSAEPVPMIADKTPATHQIFTVK